MKICSPYDSIYCSPVPSPVLTHSVASPSIIAWLMYQKYMISMPLYCQEKDKKASSKSYIWIHRTGNCEGPPVILYQYTSSRSGNHAKAFLDGFNGYHVRDAFAGYENVEGITRCLCFSHLRRYYLDAIP